MNTLTLFSPILKWFLRDKSLSNPDQGHQSSGSGSTSTDAGILVSDERAMRISTVWACTNIIVNSIASLPINFYREKEGGKKPVDSTHPMRMLFERRPNAIMKPRAFRKAILTQLCLWSNSYSEIKRTRSGTPVSVYPLRPGRTTPVILDGKLT